MNSTHYARKGEIFTKEGPNVFGLVDYGPEPVSLEDERMSVTQEGEIDDAVESWMSDADSIPF